MTDATGRFEVSSWDEDTYEKLGGEGKLTRASVTQRFTGDIEGDGSVEWLMCYVPDGTAAFVGFQRIEGTIGERRGSFVAKSVGDFDGERAIGTWTVVVGSGTGELSGLTGEGSFEAPLGPEAAFRLEYDVA